MHTVAGRSVGVFGTVRIDGGVGGVYLSVMLGDAEWDVWVVYIIFL